MPARELGHDLLPLEEVRSAILSVLEPLCVESRALAACAGDVLREDAVASELLPPFDNSAMDGFAVRAEDLDAATAAAPVTLRVQGGIAAGDVGGEALLPGSAVRIMTGAPLPPGAEAVVPHELTRFDGQQASFDKPVKRGQNVRRAGGDWRPGDVLLRAGTVLGGPQLAILAAMGRAHVCVTRRIRVAILSPGNELVDVGLACGPGQIRSSNAYALIGMLEGAGVEAVDCGIIRDTRDEVRGGIRRAFAEGADAVVTTGGASAGDYDFVQAVVREDARPGHVFKVAMRPGKPQVFGLFDGKPLLGLPGNPAAAILSFEVFVRPALRRLRGESRVLPETFGVRFPFQYRYKPGRVFLLRVALEPDDPAGFRVTPPGEQDSSHLSSLSGANAVVLLPADRDVVEAGETRPAFWLGGG